MTLTGYDAINYAEFNGLTLSKYTDPTEDAREGLTVEEARQIAAEDPNLIHVEVEMRDFYDFLGRQGAPGRVAALRAEISNHEQMVERLREYAVRDLADPAALKQHRDRIAESLKVITQDHRSIADLQKRYGVA